MGQGAREAGRPAANSHGCDSRPSIQSGQGAVAQEHGLGQPAGLPYRKQVRRPLPVASDLPATKSPGHRDRAWLDSDWLVDAAPLLEGEVERIANQMRASGHVFTDDTILPLQNDDPERRRTINAHLWVYASRLRRAKPLAVYDFSRGRSHEAPIGFPVSARNSCASFLASERIAAFFRGWRHATTAPTSRFAAVSFRSMSSIRRLGFVSNSEARMPKPVFISDSNARYGASALGNKF